MEKIRVGTSLLNKDLKSWRCKSCGSTGSFRFSCPISCPMCFSVLPDLSSLIQNISIRIEHYFGGIDGKAKI